MGQNIASGGGGGSLGYFKWGGGDKERNLPLNFRTKMHNWLINSTFNIHEAFLKFFFFKGFSIKKKGYFCLLVAESWRGGSKIKIVFNALWMTSLFLTILKTNRAHFGCFEDNGWGGGRQSENCLEKTNEEHYFL